MSGSRIELQHVDGRDLGIEFSDFELTSAGILKYTIVWHGVVVGGNLSGVSPFFQ